MFDLKDLVKIKFKSDDKLPLSKMINFPTCTIIIISVLKIDGIFIQKFNHIVVILNMATISVFMSDSL